MPRADYHRARNVAEGILKLNEITSPPISPREIANIYGIKIMHVVFDNHKEVAGFFDFSENIIYVNNEESYNRKNFTIAHELGHYFLHRTLFESHPEKYQILLRKPMGDTIDPLEQEANAFAAELLVPRDLLEKYSEYASMEELANLFAVSQDVIRYRLRSLQKTPA